MDLPVEGYFLFNATQAGGHGGPPLLLRAGTGARPYFCGRARGHAPTPAGGHGDPPHMNQPSSHRRGASPWAPVSAVRAKVD